jgi:hypothetical protein
MTGLHHGSERCSQINSEGTASGAGAFAAIAYLLIVIAAAACCGRAAACSPRSVHAVLQVRPDHARQGRPPKLSTYGCCQSEPGSM